MKTCNQHFQYLASTCYFIYFLLLAASGTNQIDNMFIIREEAMYNKTGKWRVYFVNETETIDDYVFSLQYCTNNCSREIFLVRRVYACAKATGTIVCRLPNVGEKFSIIRLIAKSSEGFNWTIKYENLPEDFQCDWKSINLKFKEIFIGEKSIITWTIAKPLGVRSTVYYYPSAYCNKNRSVCVGREFNPTSASSNISDVIYPPNCHNRYRRFQCEDNNLRLYYPCENYFTVCLKLQRRTTCQNEYIVCKDVESNHLLQKPTIVTCEGKKGNIYMGSWTMPHRTGRTVSFSYQLYNRDNHGLIKEGRTDRNYMLTTSDAHAKLTLKVKACLGDCRCSDYAEQSCHVINEDRDSNEELIVYAFIPVVILIILLGLIYTRCFSKRNRSKQRGDNIDAIINPGGVIDAEELLTGINRDMLIRPTHHYEHIDDSLFLRDDVDEVYTF